MIRATLSGASATRSSRGAVSVGTLIFIQKRSEGTAKQSLPLTRAAEGLLSRVILRIHGCGVNQLLTTNLRRVTRSARAGYYVLFVSRSPYSGTETVPCAFPD